MARCLFSSAWVPNAADSASWYSREMTLSSRFSSVGWVARNSDSVQPVHSWAPIQITGGRRAEPTDLIISAAALLLKPMVAASAVQSFIKSRRFTPCWVSSELFSSMWEHLYQTGPKYDSLVKYQ